ncbi:stage III sporulation protein AG [Clostridium sp. SM-530-WT-3G]|uniref:stage III sporulation protein AG n=1 Tax=Clostridium sp. SM-530-WT-3G TaxID=2725303 RepID=UPI00145DDA6C|nr:stage III sporulation protein AG [Clostridium sp. SM-530-WT-3G]NME83492.1 stage III sporulation protein AG [Clostridium sp. SM-530-WT-3G]
MGKSRIIDEFDKMLKDKKFRNIIILCLVTIFVLIAINVFQDSPSLGNKLTAITNKNNRNTNESTTTTTNNTDTSGAKAVTENEYEEQQKANLINILKKMDGVGDVDVLIHFENGEKKVPAYDNTTQKSTTEETDNQGGKRVNDQNTDNSKVVMTTKDGENQPFIITTIKPKIVGIVVVAEGAQNSKIKYEIEQAVSKLYNLSLDKVNVYSMKK